MYTPLIGNPEISSLYTSLIRDQTFEETVELNGEQELKMEEPKNDESYTKEDTRCKQEPEKIKNGHACKETEDVEPNIPPNIPIKKKLYYEHHQLEQDPIYIVPDPKEQKKTYKPYRTITISTGVNDDHNVPDPKEQKKTYKPYRTITISTGVNDDHNVSTYVCTHMHMLIAYTHIHTCSYCKLLYA